MRVELTDLLRCPGCRARLTLAVLKQGPEQGHVEHGLLRCSCGLEFAVWRGVPRMALESDRRLPPEFLEAYPQFRDPGQSGANARESDLHGGRLLDAQWSMYRFSRFTWGTLNLDTRLRYFERYFQQPLRNLQGRLVLDAGCGNGTLSAALASEGLQVIAFDYSDVVERAEKHRREFAGDGTVHFLLADVQHPPFAPSIFDLVYSDGVIHFTAQPRLAFSELVRVLKPGGTMVVSVSRRDRTPLYRWHQFASETFRAVALRSPIRFGRWVGFGAATLLNLAGALRRLLSGAPPGPRVSISQRAFGLWHSSVVAHHHFLESEELQSWFRSSGLAGVEDCTIAELGRTGCAARGTLLPYPSGQPIL